MGVEDSLEQLHAGSLKAFVSRRKALAQALRASGDKTGAKDVMAMSKPSLPAWVVNQLVRREPALVDEVLASIDQQRDLQLGALAGGLDVSALTSAKEAEKRGMASVAESAAAILDEDGHAPNKANVERVTRALRAAALDPQTRPLLQRGVLVTEAPAGGFEAVASQLDPALLLAALTASGRAPRKRPKVDGMFARSTRSDADAAGARDAVERPQPVVDKPQESQADRAERAALERTKRLATARIQVAEARARVQEQRSVMVKNEERIVALENELNGARAEARSSRRKLSDLKATLEQAEKRVRILSE